MRTRLAKYHLIREPGRGSTGTVYLGHDPFIDRPVAVKVARPEAFRGTLDAEQFSRLFFNEAQTAGMLRHPNIVALFDAGTADGAHYMTMEYVHDGRTLADLCRVDRLPPIDRAVRLVYRCALALDYAHRITAHRPVAVSELRADVPPVLERVVGRLLAKSPEQRYASAMDLAGDLSVAFEFLRPGTAHPDLQRRFAALRGLDFFDPLSDAELWEVLHAGVWQRLSAGARLVSEGEVERAFYVIVDGRARVVRNGQVLAVLGPGDCFGEMAVLSGRPRSATVEALGECTVLKLRASLIERASINCQVHFYRRFLDALVERLARASEHLSGGPPADGGH